MASITAGDSTGEPGGGGLAGGEGGADAGAVLPSVAATQLLLLAAAAAVAAAAVADGGVCVRDAGCAEQWGDGQGVAGRLDELVSSCLTTMATCTMGSVKKQAQ